MGFAEQWQSAQVDDNQGSEAPDPGTYTVALVDGRAFQSKAGNDTLVVEFRVVSGPAEGHEWTELRGFKSEGQVKAAKAMCSRIGVPIDEITSLEQLDSEIKRFIGLYYEVEVVQNGDYRNVYVQRQVTGEQESDVPSDTAQFETSPPAVASGEDEDIPF